MMPMRPIILKGKKVSLGIILREDIQKIWEWNNDREITKSLADPQMFRRLKSG
ncbi:hypothetical protein [Thermococcus celericrescens]|uniref:hypothetical protein n=1 Tax=Thermococcus celericrescens TaxID=227598 RepID=UPI00316ADC17